MKEKALLERQKRDYKVAEMHIQYLLLAMLKYKFKPNKKASN